MTGSAAASSPLGTSMGSARRSPPPPHPTISAYRTDLTAFVEWAERLGLHAPARSTSRAAPLPRLPHHPAVRPPHHRPQGVRPCAATSAGCAATGRRSTPTRRAACRRPKGDARLPHVLRARRARTCCSTTRRPRGRRRPDRASGARDDAVLELLYGSGLRVAELCGLDLGDLDLRRRRVVGVGQGRQAARGAAQRAGGRRALRAWLADGRDALVAAGVAAPTALFLNRRGRRAHAARRPAHPRPPRRRPRPTRTRCATPSPPTCSTAVPTCGRCRSCSATPIWRRPRSTLTSAASGCGRVYDATHPRA